MNTTKETITEITLTQALSELKMLDKRIVKATTTSILMDTLVGGNPISKVSKEDKTKEINSNLTSINSLITRRKNIKSALTQANATTNIEIGKNKLTIAEAIDYKEYIRYERGLVAKLIDEYAKNVSQVEQQNIRVEKQVADIMKNEDGKQNSTADLTASYKKMYEASLLDPLGISTLIKTKQDEIDEFETNVDFRLSEINSITKINVKI